jgi:hypothetical protein
VPLERNFAHGGGPYSAGRRVLVACPVTESHENRQLSCAAALAPGLLPLRLMFRRVVIVGLVLSLVAFAPLPLSACALLASLPGDCFCPEPRSICDHMNMDMAQPDTHVAAHPDRNCCRVTSAPLPEAQAKAPTAAAVGMPVVAVAAALPPAPPMRLLPAFEASLDISPPDSQPLLCVFLI